MSTVVTDIPDFIFELPEAFEPPPPKVKTVNNVPDVNSLTPAQKNVYDVIIAYLSGLLDESYGIVKMIALKGYAGSGKTYVITQVLKYYILMIQNNIAMTAPTNKAVKVLKATADFTHSLIKFATIHKLYGLKEQINELTGQISFAPEFGAEYDIDDTNALVVGETSMLQDDIFELIRKSNDRVKKITDNSLKRVGNDIDKFLSAVTGPKEFEDNLKVIFLGDPIQIPPIGKTGCIPFNEANADEYGILTLELTEVIRQKEGHPILDLATLVRNNYQRSELPYERKTITNDVGTVAFINRKDKDTLYRLCELYFGNARFAYDSDFIKVIAWTNRTVDFMNHKIRSFIYKEQLETIIQNKITAAGLKGLYDLEGVQSDEEIRKTTELPRILIGEKLIANSPITEDIGYTTVGVFSTNDEFEVVNYKIIEVEVLKDYVVNAYQTEVAYMDYSTNKRTKKTINILHEDSTKIFNQVVENTKQAALKAPPNERGRMWKFHYVVKSKFADVKYNYAITAHKSQGSTYDNAIVIVADIDQNKKVEERNRIKYVAFTRPKQNLFIVE